jgi:hypothetical protein
MKVAAAIAAVFALLALPVIALAHASLVNSDPAAGATITTPYTLTDTFAEEADPTRSTLTVENSSGAVVATGTVNADDETKITAALPALPDGTYTVRWTTVTSDDNGVERGTYTFIVGSTNVRPAPPCVGQDCASNQGNGGNDVFVAIGIAAVLIGAIAIAVFGGRRR